MTNTSTEIIPISETGELIFTNWDMLTLISKKIMDAGITKLGNPTQINLIVLKGKKLGIDIFESLENITVINNKTSISGALASALVERSGLLEDKSHVYEGDGDNRKCSVTVKRQDRKPATWAFSIKEAKIAGLYPGKPNSGWSSYTDSMLYWRALGFAFRREFSDVLQGMYLTEELADEVKEVKIVTDAPPVSKPADPLPEANPVPEAKKNPEKPMLASVPDPDLEDTRKAMAAPLISDPSDIPPSPLDELRKLAAKDGVSEAELIEVVNGLRLFPRGVEHTLNNLPAPKISTLIKNWQTVLRHAISLREKVTTAEALPGK